MKKMKINIFKKTQFILLTSLVFVIGIVFFTQDVQAYNQKSVTVSKNYDVYFDWEPGCGRRAAWGNVSITHLVNMINGDYTVKIGNPINFSYSNQKIFNGTGQDIGTPYFGQYQGFPNGSLTWTGGDSSVSMSSSDNSVISCSGMNCTAKGPGTATLTANISSSNADVRIMVCTQWFADNLGGGCQWLNDVQAYDISVNCTRQKYMSLPQTSVSWNVNVPIPPPTVDIKANNSDEPSIIYYNTPATLSWTSTKTNSCTASADWSGTKGLSGEEPTDNLISEQTYTISCVGNMLGQNPSDSVTVKVRPPMQCQDGIDNDGDGWVDYRTDPGCSSAIDNNEINYGIPPGPRGPRGPRTPPIVTQCSDGIDNDGDGLIDGNDPDCVNPLDNNEFIDPNFSLSRSSDINIVAGVQQNSSQSVVTVNPNVTFSSDVSLSVEGVVPPIANAIYNFGDTSLNAGEYSSGSSFWVTVPSDTKAGKYAINLKGVSGGLSRFLTIIMNVDSVKPTYKNF